MKNINIAEEFSKAPAGRYIADGPYSGQGFRQEILVPALRADGEVVVELDGVEGYGSSFLEEAFGGLVREEGFSAEQLGARLKISTVDISWEREIWAYIKDAQTAALS